MRLSFAVRFLASTVAAQSFYKDAKSGTTFLENGLSSTPTSSATVVKIPTPTPIPRTCLSEQQAPKDTYDYIIAGAGAGGITIAAKLSESGKKVLLLEKGPVSTGQYGGKLGPKWLSGTGLTRFDVPGLCNQIWHDSVGIACPDVPTMSGCVLGGGTAINAGIWWKANSADFNQFPVGWTAQGVDQAITRVFQKIPSTYIPSMDGRTYLRGAFNALSAALTKAGWTSVDANAKPCLKTKTFTQTPYMFSGGQRGGPLATYLQEATARPNFKLITNTAVKRVLRTTPNNVTGVELEPFNSNGLCGTVNLNPEGRVILSAGAYGTPKILFRSGIGPVDQLNIVKSSADGPNMVASNLWIDLPVGKNLDDHTNTDIVIGTTASQYYDFYAAWDKPVAADKDLYLNSRSGILAQSAPNIGPIMFDVVTPSSDGKARQIQWTARVQSGGTFSNSTTMVISQYLGRGKTSKGSLSINQDLTISIASSPHAQTTGDNDAIALGINNLLAVFNARGSNITVLQPAPGTAVKDFVNSLPRDQTRTANHWVGTARMGTDSGLTCGTSVVDTSTRVYGFSNLHVVDASIFPGIVSVNPAALIVSAAERAWEIIIGLA